MLEFLDIILQETVKEFLSDRFFEESLDKNPWKFLRVILTRISREISR